MTRADASLLRLDLIRRHWVTYLLVSIATLAIHWMFVGRFGLSTSTDFSVRYDPGARALLQALGFVNTGDAGPIGTYGWSRLGYICFVAASYAMWGIGNWVAMLYFQLAIVWLLYPLLFHVLLHVTDRYVQSVAAIVVWLTFLDGYQWQTWALPDALYRLMFVAAFFLLLRLWETNRLTAFVVATAVISVIGLLVRLETVLYMLPAYWLCLRILRQRSPRLLVAIVVLAVAGIWVLRPVIVTLYNFASTASQGIIFAGLGYHIEGVTRLAPPKEPTFAAWGGYYLHIYGARLWYSVTPFPAFWSRSHQLYYAIYVIPSYVFIAYGLSDATLRRNTVFQACLWIFGCGVLVRLLLHVDPPLRYAYSPQVFQFIAAAMGAHPAIGRLAAWRKPRQHGALA